MSEELKILNINVGVLGHVDSGKTSLSKALSTIASTAAFDKNPQSRERGITIDLGFSSFVVDHSGVEGFSSVQFTLVDCPGHASLIRTIIGGAQIIDFMILVVDVLKGIQHQTAECLVIGEITCENMIIVLNKIDLLPSEKRKASVDKMTKRLKLILEKTKFRGAPIIPVAANPEGEQRPMGIDELIEALKSMVQLPKRNKSGPFIFSVDHCFSIRGQGTIMTGTILQGTVHINDMVEISTIKESRRVKSVQMFRRPVESASQGDRVGICVTQFDARLLERGLVYAPGLVPSSYASIIDFNKITYFKGPIATGAKFHISLGHETVLAAITIFKSTAATTNSEDFDFDVEYEFIKEFVEDDSKNEPRYFALLEFERPISVIPNCQILGSKLDSDIYAHTCRLAFQGHLIYVFEDKNYAKKELPKLKIFKKKSKEGIVERINNDYEVICKNMFKKEANIQLFIGLKVTLYPNGEVGIIGGTFGQSGKFKVRLPDGLHEKTKAALGNRKKKSGQEANNNEQITLKLNFKRYIFDKRKT